MNFFFRPRPHSDQTEDQNLLLLAHGALPFGASLRLRLHLCRCAACRQRLAQLVQTSGVLAAAVRGGNLPAWSVSQAVLRVRQRRPSLWHAAVLGLTLAALLSVSALLAVQSQLHADHVTSSRVHCK